MTMVDGIGTHGGAESIAREVAQGLDPERFESTLCVTRWEPLPEYGSALESLRRSGVRFIGLDRKSRFDLRPWRRILAELRDRRVDVLHTHKIGSNVWGSLLAPRAGVPVFVAHEHTWSYRGNPLRKALDRRLIAPRADAFVAVSHEDQRKMVEIEHIPEEKTRFVPNGIALPDRGDLDGEAIRRELGLGPNQPVIGVVATLRPQKALDVLIDAAGMLSREFGELAVLICGGGDDREPGEPERLRRLAEGLGLERTVRFLGRRDDIPAVLAALDVGVLSSDFEGSPLSVMEYMEAGLPVVATRVGGLPDIVDEGVTGFLVPAQDPRALADAVARLLRDPAMGRRMGAAGRRLRREEFDISNTVRRVEQLYEELLAAKRAGGSRSVARTESR